MGEQLLKEGAIMVNYDSGWCGLALIPSISVHLTNNL